MSEGGKMAKRKKSRKKKNTHSRRIEDSDLAWLAEKFTEERRVNPDLTVEEFAMRYGIQVELISRYVIKPDGVGKNTVTVWHGTTEDRAKAIVEEGFKGSGRKRLWFTLKPAEARSIAQWRANQRGGEPVVFRCEINLDKYSEFDRRNPNHYAFRHSHIAKEVIRSMSGVKQDKVKRAKEKKEKKSKQESVDVVITKSSGKLGVLYWVNSYLKLKDKEPVSENHPAVEATHKWVEAQYVQGRDEPIADEEMFLHVVKHFKFESGEGEDSKINE